MIMAHLHVEVDPDIRERFNKICFKQKTSAMAKGAELIEAYVELQEAMATYGSFPDTRTGDYAIQVEQALSKARLAMGITRPAKEINQR